MARLSRAAPADDEPSDRHLAWRQSRDQMTGHCDEPGWLPAGVVQPGAATGETDPVDEVMPVNL
jgi:hypothetical protein